MIVCKYKIYQEKTVIIVWVCSANTNGTLFSKNGKVGSEKQLCDIL